MDKIKLIELVKTHKCLYDESHMHFYSIKHKSKIWESIGKELNETDISCRSAWSALKFTYSRSIQLQHHKFPYSDEMSFLLPMVKEKFINLSKEQLPTVNISGESDESSSTNGRTKRTICREKTRNRDLRLIELVKRNPVLYDPNHEYFNNKGNIQNLTWDMVADEMSLSSEACLNLWDKFKKKYKEAIRRTLNSRRMSRTAIFPYLKEFEFFKPHMYVRSQKRKSAYPNPMMDFFRAIANMVKNFPANEQISVEKEISNMVLEAEKIYSLQKETINEDHEDDDKINSNESMNNSLSQKIIYSDDDSISIDYDGFLKTIKTDSTEEMTTVDELTDSSHSLSNVNTNVSTDVNMKEEKLDPIYDAETVIEKGFIIKELPDDYNENYVKPIIKKEIYEEAEQELKPDIHFFSNIPTQMENELHECNLEYKPELIKSEPIAGPSTDDLIYQNDIKIKTESYTDTASDGFQNKF